MTVNELMPRLSEILPTIGELPVSSLYINFSGRDISVHEVNDRETLRSWASVLANATTGGAKGSHWINGRIGEWRVSVFYAAGLLGKTRSKKIVEIEETSDLDGLLAGR